ncbi:hypothetical protein MJG53_014641 [Ovis ammon polii x Ovis aries]|uniref:Uncharacterized protein n=1 Tax=Ovis ammon polii x Ovis aries TaxID=2918886 RepID=A0ACB9UH33_9CETA|nr:hypothetical protein MJG53_014641 [Ovis ammon polii x Ovis aries]
MPIIPQQEPGTEDREAGSAPGKGACKAEDAPPPGTSPLPAWELCLSLWAAAGGRGHWSLDSSGPKAPAPTRALHRECPDPPQTPLPGYWPDTGRSDLLAPPTAMETSLEAGGGGRGREPQSSLIQ